MQASLHACIEIALVHVSICDEHGVWRSVCGTSAADRAGPEPGYLIIYMA